MAKAIILVTVIKVIVVMDLFNFTVRDVSKLMNILKENTTVILEPVVTIQKEVLLVPV